MELVDHEPPVRVHDLLDKEGGCRCQLLESASKPASWWIKAERPFFPYQGKFAEMSVQPLRFVRLIPGEFLLQRRFGFSAISSPII